MNYENEMRVKFYKLLETYERVSNYSSSQVVSVMTVLDCSRDRALEILNTNSDIDDLDWSEVSWADLREFFIEREIS